MTLETKDLLKTYMGSIRVASSTSSTEALKKMLEKASGDTDTKKMWLDHAFREYLTNEVMKHHSEDLDKYDLYIEVSIKAAKDDLCSKTLPIQLLSDMFDVITLDQCESMFITIERNITLWKSEEFFTPVRNNLLRICNDLLRRLSRSQNTVFCGRILLFLAKFFPISERSGLNVVSEFNLENSTVLSKADEENGSVKEEAMDVDGEAIKIEPDQRSLAVDYALYSKFWLLQDFFRNPVQLYENVKWRTFSTYTNDVLSTFKSFKVDAISGKTQRKAEDEDCNNSKDQFFAKYLTNQNLLQLQLSDSNFRRYILLQFLILFQYLQTTVKFKSDTDVLNNDQAKWISTTEEKIFDLIRETPPNGDKFAESVKHILKREEQWNIWKNQGCPSLAPKVEPKKAEEDVSSKSNGKVGTTRKRKRKLGDHIHEAMKQGKFLMGNVALTKLWNQYPDNMEACSAPERDFLPSVEDYFSEAFEQLDPSSQIEEDYKKVNDGQWGWRALRLLAKKSPYFFTYGNNPIAKLPEYLDSMLKKMSNFVPPPSVPSAANGTKEGAAAAKDCPTPPAPATLTEDQVLAVAEKLGDKWAKLIPKLGLCAEDQEKFEKDGKDHKEKAVLMLKKWIEVEAEGATVDEITYVLEGLKMKQVLEGVFS